MAATIKRPSLELHIEIDKGSTFRHRFIWETGATESTALPVDLTGSTARMVIRASVTDATSLYELNTTNGGITLDAIGGIDLFISAADSTAFNFTKAVYGLEIIDNAGDTTRILRGNIVAFDENVR
jgi:hypothetical protein